MKSKFKVLITLILIGSGLIYSQRSFTENAEADQMTPSEIYARCYAKLLRKPAPSNNSILVSLRSGSITDAENACVNLLNKVSLNPKTGLIENPNDPEARSILTTLQLLHNSWFFSNSLAIMNAVAEVKLISDIDEPSLYWTRALLLNGARADSVLTYDKSLKAIRIRPDESNTTNFQARPFFNYLIDGGTKNGTIGVNARDPLFRIQFIKDIKLDRLDGDNYSFIDVPDDQLTHFGDMVGVKDQQPLTIERIIPPLNNLKMDDPSKPPNSNIDLHAHFGGGVLGSTIYQMKNTGLLVNQLPNSYTSIDRRFASRVFQDLLCYQLPVLDSEDVEIIKDPSGTSFAFHQNKSCMQCHATIDEFAMIQKNMTWVESSPAAIIFKKPSIGAEVVTRFKLPVDKSSKVFALQDPVGELNFKTFNKTKVHIQNIRNLASVGSEFAKLDDFYTCAAKRYYKYFTGIDVPLAKDAETSLNAVEIAHLVAVRKLGLQLKEDPNQKLKNVIISIFKSPVFQSRGYKTQGVGK